MLGNYLRTSIDYLLYQLSTLFKLRPGSFLNKIILYRIADITDVVCCRRHHHHRHHHVAPPCAAVQPPAPAAALLMPVGPAATTSALVHPAPVVVQPQQPAAATAAVAVLPRAAYVPTAPAMTTALVHPAPAAVQPYQPTPPQQTTTFRMWTLLTGRVVRPHRICVAYRCGLYLAMFMVCL